MLVTSSGRQELEALLLEAMGGQHIGSGGRVDPGISLHQYSQRRFGPHWDPQTMASLSVK